MNTATTKSARFLINTLDTLNVPTSDTLAATITAADKLRNHTPNTGPSIAEAIAAAITKGTDPATDRDVKDAVTRAAISTNEIREELNQHADTTTAEAIEDDYDAIMDGLKERFNTEAATLTEAHTTLHGADLTNTNQILARGAAAATAWGAAQTALQQVNLIRAAWDSLATITRKATSTGGGRQALIYCEVPDIDTYRDGNYGNLGLDPWGVLTAGGTLALASHAEYQQRGRTITNSHNAETQANEKRTLSRVFPGAWG